MRHAFKSKTVAMVTSTLLLLFASSADAGMWMGMGHCMWMGRGMGHHHRAHYCSPGSWGSWAGSPLPWSSCGSYGGCGYRIYRIYRIYRPHGAHSYPYYGNPGPAYPAHSRISSARQNPVENSTLGVHVPAGATVYVNGYRTESTGTYREFELRSRRSRHSYRVRAVVDDNGRELAQAKLAILPAGRSAEMSFDFNTPVVSDAFRGSATQQQSAQNSRLKVKVPEYATVFVNGRRTKSTGTHREYELQTRRSRQSYRVRAVVDNDGLVLSETKLVFLSPGVSAEMSFGLDADVALNSEPGSETVFPVRILKERQVRFAARDGMQANNVSSTHQPAARDSLTDFGRVTLVNFALQDSKR